MFWVAGKTGLMVQQILVKNNKQFLDLGLGGVLSSQPQRPQLQVHEDNSEFVIFYTTYLEASRHLSS